MIICDTIKTLLENDKEQCIKATNVLLKIANNILIHPSEEKYRKINLNSETTENILIPTIGALEILFIMGFEEGSEKLILPQNASLDNVTLYRDQLEKFKRENFAEADFSSSASSSKDEKPSKKQLSSAEIAEFIVSEAEMKKTLKLNFEQVLIFENSKLQEDARQTMPYKKLQENARIRETELRALHTDDKKPPFNFQDCLLLELIEWFKDEFFEWFDQGFCEPCKCPMMSTGYVEPNVQELAHDGHRVEHYQCEKCSNSVRFPRYFHPGKLMETRKGRCMEWASCFALMCRTLGFDTRYIWDETDHVWTEIFSVSQNRWIHADPCEKKVDCPLIYERGWGKKLSYVFSFSKDEVVDCVWRYSTQHKQVCERRNKCREPILAVILNELNQERWRPFSAEKRKFLESRLVKEISGFFSEPKINSDAENEGRLSGSLSWRLARGETNTTTLVPYTFATDDKEEKLKEMIIKYSAAEDIYHRGNNDTMKGWIKGVYSMKNMSRKVEKDWKMVYIARTEGAEEGELTWKFDWSSRKSLQVKSVMIVFQNKTFEDAQVLWQVCAGDLCFPGNQDGVLQLSDEELGSDCKGFQLSVSLLKGKGDHAWQHAQLFRQPENDSHFPFLVKITFV